MKIRRFVLGSVETNCYVVNNEETNEGFLVDPGLYQKDVSDYIKQENITLHAILLTHGHFDHIMGIDDFLKEFDVPVYAYEMEERLLNYASLNCSDEEGPGYTFSGATYLTDGQEITIAGFTIQVLYTPGHTIGGCCYYLPEEKVLFSGDTLFCRSVGRTDFPTGNTEQLIDSIQEKLMPLPDDVKVYPGHMEETSIGEERAYNPFIRG